MPDQYPYVGTAPVFRLLRLDGASPEPRARSANNPESRAQAVVNERFGLLPSTKNRAKANRRTLAEFPFPIL